MLQTFFESILQTNGWMDRQTNGWRNRQTDRQTGEIDTLSLGFEAVTSLRVFCLRTCYRQIDRWTDRQMDRETDRETDRQTDRQMER